MASNGLQPFEHLLLLLLLCLGYTQSFNAQPCFAHLCNDGPSPPRASPGTVAQCVRHLDGQVVQGLNVDVGHGYRMVRVG